VREHEGSPPRPGEGAGHGGGQHAADNDVGTVGEGVDVALDAVGQLARKLR
jgi:hypothetical protein